MSGNGVLRGLEGASLVVRSDIEQAARCGYLDALDRHPLSAEYEIQTDKWQRNYEIGRLWVSNFRCEGIDPPAWPLGGARPLGFDALLTKLSARMDSVVPRGERMALDPGLDFRVRLHPRRRR